MKIKSCNQCNIKFEWNRSKGRGLYCSRVCADKNRKNPIWLKGTVKNPNYTGRPRGKSTNYDALHYRVKQDKIKPDECVKCNKKSNRLELANIRSDRKCTDNIEDYMYMCVKCHREFDGSVLAQNQFVGKGENNGNSKLNNKQVKRIRKLYYGNNISIAEIARKFSMSWSAIDRIIKNKSWIVITEEETDGT